MRESLASTAQYTLNSSANAAGLLLVRAKVKASKGVPDININDLVVFCAIKALLEVPDLNAEFIDGRIYKHAAVHIGFACDTPRGLIVPVVRDAAQDDRRRVGRAHEGTGQPGRSGDPLGGRHAGRAPSP